MVVLTAGLLSGMLASYWLTRPLNTLSKAAQSIGERNLSKRVHFKGAREIRALGLSFNEMAEALQEAETRRQNLLADVAHELRTPLMVLQNNLRAILDDVYELDKTQIFTLYSQTRQLNHLVDDLHALAQADAHQLPLHIGDIDMVGLIEQAGELFEPLAQEDNINLCLSTPDNLPVLRGDRARVIQVVQNLLTNAMRHADSRVDVRLWQHGKSVCVDVENDGGGIAAEHLPYVFDRFYRIDKSRSRESGGSGLGLAVAQAIVNAHNGIITAVSDGLEQGTTIRFELPMT
jgi:signal transduction histidine kinase